MVVVYSIGGFFFLVEGLWWSTELTRLCARRSVAVFDD
jgi:hypothetical protein